MKRIYRKQRECSCGVCEFCKAKRIALERIQRLFYSPRELTAEEERELSPGRAVVVHEGG